MKTNQLNLPKLEAELQEAAGNWKVVVIEDKTIPFPTSIQQAEGKIEIRINPNRVHTLGQREKIRQYLIKQIGG